MQKETIQGIKLGLMVSFSLIIFVLILGFYAWNIEPNTLSVQRISLDVGMNESAKIVFIADLHVGTRSDKFLEQVVEKINSEKPDYIFLGGDYVEQSNEIPRLEILKKLESSKGTYAVLGNHEYYLYEKSCTAQEENAVADFLSSQGIKVLRNENVDLEGFVLVGVDDYWACRSDYINATKEMDYAQPIVLLTHNQEAIPKEEYGKLNLALVGHTHCGQVRLPLIGSIPKLLGFRGEYDAGLHKFDEDSYIYTTCGISGGPRFMAPPEITVIELS